MLEPGRNREDEFRQFLALPHGIPDEDTFWRGIERLKPGEGELTAALQQRLGTMSEAGGRAAAIDGKMIRGSGKTGEHQALRQASAWVWKDLKTVIQRRLMRSIGEEQTVTGRY